MGPGGRPAADVTDGRDLLRALRTDTPARPPYIPLLGRLACELGQVDEMTFTTDAHTHGVVLAETAAALKADVVTIGLGTDPAVGVDAVRRLRPLLKGRAVAGCLAEADVAGARAYCQAGAGLVLLVSPDGGPTGRFRTLANVCAFYQVLAVLVDPGLPDGAGVAAGLGLHGAVVAEPSGEEPGVVGGGLPPTLEAPAWPVRPPRPARFFWAFPGETPSAADAGALAALGARLTG
jgi:hypothetical protein